MYSQDAAKTALHFQPVADLLQQAEEQLQKLTDFSAAAGLPFEVSSYRQGKRLRPALVLLASAATAYPDANSVTAAAALEAVHLASLLHDDVVDETSVRRGSGTLNSRFGNKFSILIGDYILAQATQTLANLHNNAVIQTVTQAARDMSRGQLLELQHKGDVHTTVDCYLTVIGAKTASLLSACCSVGALLSEANPDVQEALSAYGQNLGMAFQITDDILDIWGTQEVLGKPVLSDIQESKFTLPVLIARDQSQGDELRTLLDLLENPSANRQKDKLLHLLNTKNAKEQSLARARSYTDLAARSLQCLPPGPAVQTLADIAAWVADRQK